MNTDTYPNIYDFTKCRNVAICGDIHGDFNLLVNKVCIQYQMKDTLIIVAGDCGFGFERKGYYENIAKFQKPKQNQTKE